jgi:protein phosphatase
MLTTIKSPIAFSETGKRSYKENVIFPDSNSQNTNTRFFMICSGDGGDEKSEAGANLIAQHFAEYFAKSKSLKTERLGQVYMNDMLRHTERKLQNYIQQNPKMVDTEGSVALLHFNEDGSVSAAWVGNCRIYQIRNGEIVYRTEDHIVSNWDPRGNARTKPRSISAVDSAWASVTTLTDVLANDYFLVCSPGITETIDDRHVRYLFSQTDNADSTNRAIASKIKDECAKSSQGNYSAILLQIEKSPFKVKPQLVYKQPTNVAQKPVTGQISPPKNPTGAIEMPRESKLKMPSVSINPAMLRNLGIAALALLVVGSLLLYKMYTSTPDKVFAKHLQQAETQNQAGAYESAISELEAALLLAVPDSLKGIAQQKLLANKQDLAEREAKKWLDKGNLLKAKLAYDDAFKLDTTNTALKKQIADLQLTIGSEKKKLLSIADSLLKKQQYETAKGFLFDALYLDQTNARIVKAINVCNIRLKQDTMSLEIALKEANTKAETGTRTVLSPPEAPPTTVTVPAIDSAALKAAAARKRRRANDSINSFYNGNTYGQPIYNSPSRTTTQGDRTVQSGTGGVVRYGVSETHTGTPATTTPTRTVTPPPAPLPPRETTPTAPEETKPEEPK